MVPDPLKKDQLQKLYNQYKKIQSWKSWIDEYLSVVEKFRIMPEDQLRSVENQEALWKAKEVSGIGPGESVDVSGAYDDVEIVDLIVGLRGRAWEESKVGRAKEIQSVYSTILKKVYPKYARVRPQAKLGRLLAALIPEHTYTCFNWVSRQNVKNLILGDKKVGSYEGAALIRERLREALGVEQSIEEHIQRSTFCWWLHENYEEIVSGDSEEVMTKATPTPNVENQQKLILWPFAKQGKGLNAVKGYIESYRSVVGAAENGASRDDIVETMRSELGFEQSPKSCRVIFNDVRKIGLLKYEGGIWYPSEAGMRLTEEDPPDVLVEKFLVETFGLAHLLKILKENQKISKNEVYGKMRALYPRWTTNMAPNATILWARSLGLVEIDDDARPILTEYGLIWCDRLPEELEVPEGIVDIEVPGIGVDNETIGIEDEEVVWPGLSEILDQFKSDEQLARFVFEDGQIGNLHVAWHCNNIKRFVLLSGLSGTGKTAILSHYARIYCELLDREVSKHCTIISVSPDWRDPSGLIGYFNALHADPTFQIEPALRLVLDAAKNPALPYFLILDEMNLAKVERYFAPFLSAMETGEWLHLHAHDDEVNGVPPSIKWPKNLFIGGTVNMDETTHPFSDKVLDRAFTFEFWDVNLDTFLTRRATEKGGFRHHNVEKLLLQLHSELEKIRRQFAYRTTGEILDYFDKAKEQGLLNEDAQWQLIDQVIFAKVLPRIRGEESEQFKQTIKTLKAICDSNGMDKCSAKLDVMKNQLDSIGVTRFWA